MRAKIATVATLAASAAVALSGCQSTGNQVLREQTNETVAQKISKGTSTKAQVRQAYGDPNETSFTDSGNEIWKYQYTHSELTALGYVPIVNIFAGGADIDKSELVVLFDKNGVVANFSVQQSKQQIRRGTNN